MNKTMAKTGFWIGMILAGMTFVSMQGYICSSFMNFISFVGGATVFSGILALFGGCCCHTPNPDDPNEDEPRSGSDW
jgi:hypothetical protein